MGKLKDRLYNALVRKNGRVWYEYERYVRENMEEHRLHRFKHLVVLFKLNWFYRVKKGNTPYLYWDVPLNPKSANSIDCSNKKSEDTMKKQNSVPVVPKSVNKITTNNKKVEDATKKQNIVKSVSVNDVYFETKKNLCSLEVHLAKAFAQYEYVIINIFDTLIYSYLNDKHNFFNLIGQELGIPMFAKIREKVEEELRNSARINGKEKSINVWDIYREIERYTKVPCEKGVETEVRLLERISKVNPYIRAIYEMISYKSKNVLLVEDSIYSSEQLMYLLEEKQITGYKELIISNECGKSIFDGTIFELLETKLETKNVLYIDDSLTGRKQAKNLSWEIWEYKDIKEFGKDFRLDGMSVLISDVYSSIISQRMYCGHFAYSLQYEAGFLYYGLFVAGYIKWINSQIKKLKIEKVLFLEETSDLLKKCFEIIAENKEIKQDVLWITEDFAVKILVEKYPIFFYEHYVKKYINSNKPISFYLEKMGLFGMADKLSNYGLNASDIISRDSIYYGAFVDFIEDNFAIIQESIAQEKRAFCMYLKGLRIKEKNIAVVDVSGKGYIALAMEMILKEELNIVCRVRELAAFQSIETEELLYNNWVQAYISADNIRTGDIRIIDNELIQNRTRNILSNIAPLFKKIVVNDAGIFEFVYEGAYPWKYKNIEDNQNGIVDFVKEYANFLKMSRISCQVLPEDVLRVLNHLYKRTNYVTKVFSIIRS